MLGRTLLNKVSSFHSVSSFGRTPSEYGVQYSTELQSFREISMLMLIIKKINS